MPTILRTFVLKNKKKELFNLIVHKCFHRHTSVKEKLQVSE